MITYQTEEHRKATSVEANHHMIVDLLLMATHEKMTESAIIMTTKSGQIQEISSEDQNPDRMITKRDQIRVISTEDQIQEISTGDRT